MTLVYQAPGGGRLREEEMYLHENKLHLPSVRDIFGLHTMLIKLNGVVVAGDTIYSPLTYVHGARIRVSGIPGQWGHSR